MFIITKELKKQLRTYFLEPARSSKFLPIQKRINVPERLRNCGRNDVETTSEFEKRIEVDRDGGPSF